MKRCSWIFAIALVLGPASAQADESESESESASESDSESDSESAPESEPPADIHFGLNLRTDLGAHPLRLDVGARWEMIDVALVLDPWVLSDGMMSTDLLGFYRSPWGVAPMLGYRLTTVGIVDGPQLQHNVLVGIAGDLPRFFGGWLRAQAGLELAATVVRHGGGLPLETIGFSGGSRYIDLLNFALFVRGEVAVPLGGMW